jgi:hypothetical protein
LFIKVLKGIDKVRTIYDIYNSDLLTILKENKMPDYPTFEHSEFKGNKLCKIVFGTYTPKGGEEREDSFQFGIKKARGIVKHIDKIKKFVEDNSDARTS